MSPNWFDDPVDDIRCLHDLLLWRQADSKGSHQLWISWARKVVMAAPDTNLLVLGPPQGSGKTSGQAMPQGLMAQGPLVFLSVKEEATAAIGMARALYGTVWQWCPDGEAIVEGAVAMRWGPVAGCWSYDEAGETAAALVKGASSGSVAKSSNSVFFDVEARKLLRVLLFYANQFGHDEQFVYELVANPQPGGKPGSGFGLMDVHQALEARGFGLPAKDLMGIMRSPERQRGGTFSTAAQVLDAYSRTAVLDACRYPNFSIEKFLQGDPDVELPTMFCPRDPGDPDDYDLYLKGSYDTVLITAAEQEQCGPLLAAFYKQLERAGNRAHRKARKAALYDATVHMPVPCTLIFDELGHTFEFQGLPQLLAKGNQGFLVTCILQDLSQAKKIWGDEIGRGMLTLFQNIVVYRGIRDKETLETISGLAGQRWETVTNETEGTSDQGLFTPVSEQSGTSYNQQQVPDLPIDAIGRMDPNNPDVVLYLDNLGGYRWVRNTPYFRCTPWKQVLVASVEQIAALPISDSRRLLPPPSLDFFSGGSAQLQRRYLAAVSQLDCHRRETRKATNPDTDFPSRGLF